MLFTTRVCYQHAPELEEEAKLLSVRYYIAATDQQLLKEQREQDLTLRHLVWEESAQQVQDSHASVFGCGAGCSQKAGLHFPTLQLLASWGQDPFPVNGPH